MNYSWLWIDVYLCSWVKSNHIFRSSKSSTTTEILIFRFSMLSVIYPPMVMDIIKRMNVHISLLYWRKFWLNYALFLQSMSFDNQNGECIQNNLSSTYIIFWKMCYSLKANNRQSDNIEMRRVAVIKIIISVFTFV